MILCTLVGLAVVLAVAVSGVGIILLLGKLSNKIGLHYYPHSLFYGHEFGDDLYIGILTCIVLIVLSVVVYAAHLIGCRII